ncbi:hypothetical protein [Hydrogenimonas sp. SS33]|uniref:hypothetical protein n=1 Tax=Hydrogenimonas leucolamina TaxID=2954236 RepID=UPI00336BDD46
MGDLFQSEPGFVWLFLLYLLISAAAAFAAAIFLKKEYPNQRRGVFLFFLLFNQSMPVIGLLFTVWVVWYLKHVEYPRQLHKVELLDLEEFAISFPEVRRSFGEGAMLLLFENDQIPPQMKIRALTSLANELSRNNLEIIKLALSDRNDEVRLFCFSVVDKLEKRINEQITIERERFEKSSLEKDRVDTAERLAKLYWDLVYYALSDEVLEKFMVRESKRFALFVLKHRYASREMHTLLGKIYLYEKDYEKAAQEFALAIELEEETSGFIAPYLAEVFYIRRNFVSVKSLINSDEDIMLNPKLYHVAQMWRGVS